MNIGGYVTQWICRYVTLWFVIWQGRRFDLVCRSLNREAKYPGLGVKVGEEDRVPYTTR